MKSSLDLTFAKLTNPRMSAGLMVLHSLLGTLQSSPIPPREVREQVDTLVGDRPVSKQSITNAARRLEEANVLERGEGYSVNYGYLLSVLLQQVIHLNECVRDLEEEVAALKSVTKSLA
ncbi:MAG: hypothetical protein ACW99U_06845 [Candidatus Thorarchaeota archaeon]